MHLAVDLYFCLLLRVIMNSVTTSGSPIFQYRKQAKEMQQISKAIAENTYAVKPFIPTAKSEMTMKKRKYCIPSMFVGIVVDQYQFGKRLFKSIDHCIRNLIVMVPQKLDFREHRRLIVDNKRIHNITVVRSLYKLFSVSEGWNIGLKMFPKSAWFLICNYDVTFIRGQLAELSYHFWSNSELDEKGRPKIEIGFYNWQNLLPAGYNLFALTPTVIRRLGYFDENYFPAFYEDYDYDMRLEMAGIRRKCYLHINPWHGTIDMKGNSTNYISGTVYISEVS